METDKQYFLNAGDDVERLARNHEIIKQAMGGSLVLAPIDLTRPDLRVLDTGTSDGFWIRDFLRDYPAVKSVVGTDIDQSRFPQDMPEGVSLVQHDILQPFPEQWKDTYDLAHQRLLLVGSRGDPQPIVERLCRVVKPGGWVQMIEADQSIGELDGPAMKQFLVLMKAMVDAMQTPFYFARDLAKYLKAAGFVRVGEMTIPTSYGVACPRPELRQQSITSFLTAISGLIGFAKGLPTGIPGLSPQDLDALPSALEAELREQGGYYPLRAVWGQKPLVLSKT